jgi:cysteinyl-tRNA synthetase
MGQAMTDAPAPPLKLFNSLTRRLEIFEPVHPGVPGDPANPPEARVYSCGPTVYNYPHIGNMRAYVFADTLGRTLSFKGYKLTHVINITDVGHLTDDADAGEDKLEKAAAEKAQSIWDIARHYTEAYWADVKALNIRQPAHWSIATDYVPQMIEFAKAIADKHCYELDSGLYFDTSTVADYGRLARHATDEGESRIDPVDGKRHPADFAIWRKTPPGEKRQMEWDSPWGKGAPGWHLECSVMSEALLGFPFDIHTGGIDHREIHHPNEIAQNQAHSCSADSGARIWMHNNFLVERSGKMSKSSGEFLRVQLLIDKGYHPLAYRLMCLQAHYRSELEFSWEGLGAALTRLKRLVMAVEKLDPPRNGEVASHSDDGGGRRPSADAVQDRQPPPPASPVPLPVPGRIADLLAKFDAAMSDDLNTPVALTLLEEAAAMKKVDASQKRAAFAAMDAVLGLDLLTIERADLRVRPKSATIAQEEIETALAKRKEARAAKDFATSDKLRDELIAAGVEVMDGDPLGWDWRLEG